MATYPAIYAAGMSDQQRAVYYAELSVLQKDEVLGVVLAVFLGTFGAHHFYMRRTGLGILYCVLSVTGFSTIAGFVEAFFMPERIRRFNASQAAAIAGSLGFYPYGPAGPGPFATGISGPAFGSGPYPVPPYAPASSVSAVPVTLPAGTVCSSCGEAVAGGVKFCSKCGTAVQA